MPFDRIPAPRSKSSSIAYPFALSLTSVDTSKQTNVQKSDFDCACPCNSLLPTAFITSSKIFKLTNQLALGVTQSASTTPTNPANVKQAVVVSATSFLFKGILPPQDYNTSDSNVTKNNLNANPLIKIYGLNVPIVLDGFLDLTQPTSAKTLKIWLTCCYASGEATVTPDTFSGCKTNMDTGTQSNVAPNYPYLIPQVAFISAGVYWPQNLAVKKLVNKGTTAQPLYDRRTIEAHVPIGEVSSSGAIIAQHLKTNLTLADMCLNGAPVKYPIAMFNILDIIPPAPTTPPTS